MQVRELFLFRDAESGLHDPLMYSVCLQPSFAKPQSHSVSTVPFVATTLSASQLATRLCHVQMTSLDKMSILGALRFQKPSTACCWDPACMQLQSVTKGTIQRLAPVFHV